MTQIKEPSLSNILRVYHARSSEWLGNVRDVLNLRKLLQCLLVDLKLEIETVIGCLWRVLLILTTSVHEWATNTDWISKAHRRRLWTEMLRHLPWCSLATNVSPLGIAWYLWCLNRPRRPCQHVVLHVSPWTRPLGGVGCLNRVHLGFVVATIHLDLLSAIVQDNPVNLLSSKRCAWLLCLLHLTGNCLWHPWVPLSLGVLHRFKCLLDGVPQTLQSLVEGRNPCIFTLSFIAPQTLKLVRGAWFLVPPE